jgi:hypothetical protein
MRRSTAFFAEAAAVYRTPFWSSRADTNTATSAATDAAGEWSDEALAADSGVRRAFDYLRATDRLRLRASSSVRVQPVAAIEGCEVVMRNALVVPGVGAPLRFAAGVDLPALTELARDGEDVSTLIAAYQRHVAPAPAPGVLAGLSLLVAHQVLVTEVSAS